eukprot:9095605-Pyramimonas_sp.AAC.1
MGHAPPLITHPSSDSLIPPICPSQGVRWGASASTFSFARHSATTPRGRCCATGPDVNFRYFAKNERSDPSGAHLLHGLRAAALAKAATSR